MRRAGKSFFAAIAGGVAAFIGAAFLAGAPSAVAEVQSVASVNDEMPSSVEGFSYPGADQVFEERGIKLKRGDGRLLFVECSTAYDVMVESLAGRAGYCFKATGKHGFLTMELAGAYHIWTEGHPVRAKLTAEGETTTVDVPKNAFRPVGEADSTTGRKRSVLVELRITG